MSADGASELIQAVNQFRASYGMAPLVIDPILMAVAEAQNNYSISIGFITHYGPDGSRPKQQAIAAGYGGGATVFISENIAMGTDLTAAGAVQAWTGDEPHLNTMIGTYYRDVGAGVGQDGDGSSYYTLITGYVAGGYSAGSTAPAGGFSFPVGPAPVIKATPQADGSIVHTVETGQTLWTIAAVYDVELEELLELNRLAGSAVLHPGDKITVRRGLPPTPTVAEASNTPRTSAGRRATPSISPRRARTPTPTPVPFETPPNPASWAMIGIGLTLLAAGVVFGLRRR
ncbi:MAG TPA: CAP domain-containing protein [Anaerolineales bacterium]|nr:CAP domain-containing protein [Anaerolineales bacterium]